MDLYSKRLDLLRQIVRGMRRVGIVYNPDRRIRNEASVVTRPSGVRRDEPVAKNAF